LIEYILSTDYFTPTGYFITKPNHKYCSVRANKFVIQATESHSTGSASYMFSRHYVTIYIGKNSLPNSAQTLTLAPDTNNLNGSKATIIDQYFDFEGGQDRYTSASGALYISIKPNGKINVSYNSVATIHYPSQYTQPIFMSGNITCH
jgi:expansin (peptidoglycan-binding protein)